MKERRYVASALQSLPVTRPPFWDQSTLEETRVPVPLEGQIVCRNGKALRERIQRRGVSTMSNGELLSVSLGGNEKVVQQIETLLTNYSLQQLYLCTFEKRGWRTRERQRRSSQKGICWRWLSLTLTRLITTGVVLMARTVKLQAMTIRIMDGEVVFSPGWLKPAVLRRGLIMQKAIV
jgi:hypothetical protein